MRIAVALSASIVLSGCVAEPARVSGTTWPQAVIAAPRSVVREQLISAAATTSGTIVSADDSMIQIRVPSPNAALAKAMFGCGACADPYMRVNFILSSVGDSTQVVTQYWMVVPKFGGSEERMDDTSARDFNDAQNLLWKLRDQYAKTP